LQFEPGKPARSKSCAVVCDYIAFPGGVKGLSKHKRAGDPNERDLTLSSHYPPKSIPNESKRKISDTFSCRRTMRIRPVNENCHNFDEASQLASFLPFPRGIGSSL
jgi:hypothetical protein